MSQDISIKKGLSINIKGAAEKELKKIPLTKFYAHNLHDFHLLIPKLEVKVGDYVKRGQPLFYSKTNESIKFVSNVSGHVKDIVRGERRKILNIIIECDKKDSIVTSSIKPISKLDSESIIKSLLSSGCWPFIKQRPFDIIADPTKKPKSIFISCFDSAPLAIDYKFILNDRLDYFKYGLEVLKKLVSGNLYLGLNSSQSDLAKQLTNFNLNYFNGPHPSGNVGVHIHHIDPINSGEVVWILNPEDVAIIGEFFETGQFNPERTVAVSGPPVKNPKYYRLIIGAELKSVLSSVDLEKGSELRYINGDVLSGKTVSSNGFLGFYNNNLSILREGNNYKLFGWIPFINNKTPSIYKTSFSWLSNGKPKEYDTNLNGEKRAFVTTGEMESVFPMDVYPMQLIKECLIGDIEKMEKLGIYEVSPEDFGLIDYSSSSKIEAQSIIREGLDYLYKETQ
jgi:Na+-transporting NADH:ubiquinone oxidoreductase subunit A